MNNIIHFSGDDISLNELSNIMNEKKEQYYTVNFNNRNELHIVKHNSGYFKVNEMLIQLFEFYKTNKIELDEDISIKGNNDFVIINNITNTDLKSRIKTDLNTLLKNK